jgi:hypothetical protein
MQSGHAADISSGGRYRDVNLGAPVTDVGGVWSLNGPPGPGTCPSTRSCLRPCHSSVSEQVAQGALPMRFLHFSHSLVPSSTHPHSPSPITTLAVPAYSSTISFPGIHTVWYTARSATGLAGGLEPHFLSSRDGLHRDDVTAGAA